MSNKYVRSMRGLYERRIIAIMLSAIITIVVQTTLLFPNYQSDATSDDQQVEEVIEKDTKTSIFYNPVKTQALLAQRTVNDAVHLMSVFTETTTTTTTTATTTSETTTTTTTTSTTSETTTTTTTTVEPTTAEEVIIAEVEPTEEEPVEDVSEEDAPSEDITSEDEPADVPEDVGSGDSQELPISESDFILLCNCVGLEYGADWVSVQEKALVVEVIMNRVNHSAYPNTIYGVISAPYQFSGSSSYLYLDTYSTRVTESVKEAVRYYFDHPDEFQHGYYGFWGDGYRNHFR